MVCALLTSTVMTVHKRWLIPFTEELVTWRQYVFIALMIVLILIMGVGDSEARELIYPASVATLVVVMEVIGFALLALGLVVQLTRFELGLGLVGLGLFCSSFAVFPIQFVAYPIVCYQNCGCGCPAEFSPPPLAHHHYCWQPLRQRIYFDRSRTVPGQEQAALVADAASL